MFPWDWYPGEIGWLLIIVPVFLMPSVIACVTKRPHFCRFVICNLIFAWLYIGWLVLVWKALHPPPPTTNEFEEAFAYFPPIAANSGAPTNAPYSVANGHP